MSFGLIHAERLLRLAEHLERGKLGHDRFNYGHLSRLDSCGTSGCAIGELWTCFPELSYQPRGGFLAMRFFELNQIEVAELFYPRTSSFCGYSNNLEPTASKYEVASHIRAFTERKCKELGISLSNARLAIESEQGRQEEVVHANA